MTELDSSNLADPGESVLAAVPEFMEVITSEIPVLVDVVAPDCVAPE